MANKHLLRIIEDPYFILVSIFGILALLIFLALPKEKKKQLEFLLTFSFITLVAFYENFSSYLLVDKSLNSFFHSIISDTPFQGWNLWAYNLFNYQISKVVLLMLILGFIYDSRKRRILSVILSIFIIACITVQVLGIEPLYNFQTSIYFLGNSSLIIASGFYFIDLITHEKHLSINPLKDWKFWISTLILFQTSMTFLVDVGFEYIALNHTELYIIFNILSKILYIIILLIMTLFLVSGVLWKKPKTSNTYDVGRG